MAEGRGFTNQNKGRPLNTLVIFLLLIILTVIIMVLAAICIQKQVKISSLKREVDFLQDSLNHFTEKETGNIEEHQKNTKVLPGKQVNEYKYQKLK